MQSAKQFVRIGIVYLEEAVLFASPKRLIPKDYIHTP